MRFAPVLVALLLAACQAQAPMGGTRAPEGEPALLAARKSCPPLATGKPFYRVFRGARRADVTPAAFIQDMSSRFIPAAPRTHGGKGLVAYVPAIPPANAPEAIPDELAIVVYESEAKYKERRETPEGKAYADMHWELFDKERSKSDGAVPYATNGKALEPNVPVDVMDQATDWMCGHTALFIGQRQLAVPAADYLGKVSEHVAHARASLGAMGLDGYIVVGTEQFVVAFMHFPSEGAMTKAFATPAGRAVAAEGGAISRTISWTAATTFDGAIAPGEAVNVKFAR